MQPVRGTGFRRDGQLFAYGRSDATVVVARNPFASKNGDLNCDGAVDFRDIDPFVLALSDPAACQAAFPECDILNADCNGDGTVDFADIDPFVALLGG